MRKLLLFVLVLALVLLVMPALALAQDGTVINPSTDLGMWSLLVGVLLPGLVAVVQRQTWSNKTRVAVGVGASAVAAFGTTYLTEGDALWDQGMLHAFLLIAVAAWASYQSLWKASGVGPAIERATSPSPSPPG